MQTEIRASELQPLIDVLSKTTTGPGEAAVTCLALFIHLWTKFDPQRSLEQTADDARHMILSYRTGEESPVQ